MPQFDFTTYSSQIFWLLICFALLYSFSQFVILPRIREILKERKNIISADRSSAETLEQKIYQLENKTDKLRKEAAEKYKNALEEANKQAVKERETLLEELKDKTEKMVKNSRQELNSFIEKTEAKSQAAIQDLAKALRKKFL
jgi:F-type H+-transporting ATPase subunit b